MADFEQLFSFENMTFEEAVSYFSERIPITAAQFRRLADEYRNLAFTVSGYTSARILNQFYEAILEAIEEGKTMQQFRSEMNEFLELRGYEGLTLFQADNIFRTNIQTAYNAGHHAQMTQPEVLAHRPYWQYDAVNDSRTRPSHLAMDGKVFPADSPIWDIWYPPNGFRCRCTVRSLSQRDVERMGLTVEDDVLPIEQLPDGRFVGMMPDPQFSTNPAKTRFEPDMEGYPESIVQAYKSREETTNR